MTISNVSSGVPVRFEGARLVIKALVSGAAVALAGLQIWGGLLFASTRYAAFGVWAAPIMAAILLGGAAWLKWGTWPQAGRAFRREAARLNPVSLKSFLYSLGAGWTFMLAGFAFYVAHRITAGLGGESALQLPHAPFILLLPGLVMAAVAAGTVEEVAFRGFIQTTFERRFGLLPALVVSGLAWASFHLNHGYFAENYLLWLAIFLGVGTMLGTIAHRTNSIIPGIAVHSGFDSAYFIAAGLLAPHTTPIAWLESVASPVTLNVAGGVFTVLAIVFWAGFIRATRN